MRAPFEQYGVYLVALGGSAYMAKSFFRAHHLTQYAKIRDFPGRGEEAQFAADMAHVAPHQLERPGLTVARLRTRGLAVAIAAPVLWIALRVISQTPTMTYSLRTKVQP